MRTIIVKHNIYKYSELSKKSKEKVKNDYIEDLSELAFIFTDSCNDRLKELFPNSNLKVQYSLNHCQGDGLNIYGTLNLNDVLENLKEKFIKKDVKSIKQCLNKFSEFKMPYNQQYNYCICDRHDYTMDLIEELELDSQIEEFMNLDMFDRYIKDYMSSLCKEFEGDGYNYFYPDLSDEEMEEIAEANSWEFYENGKIYNE